MRKALDKTKYGWWKQAVFYQIYPKSFRDSNGDGVGDLPGILSKLDYLEDLGIDGIWLSPVFASPQADNGYDVSDYCAIDPLFGTMEDMERLIRDADKRGISIILDLVLNHSSEKHAWFQQALKGRDDPCHGYYIWRDGDGVTPPNDMRSVFGGPAWTYVPELGQYYFHQFSPEQPDLNWENPELRRQLYRAIRFWVDKGVQGFRLDVIDQIAKDPDAKITANGPRLHEYLRELKQQAFPEAGIVTVGETWSADVPRARIFSAPDGSELSMVFQFQHICLDQQGEKWNALPLDLPELKACFCRWQTGLRDQGWNSLFFNNHDLPRIVSRWGDEGQYREKSAKMLGTFLHGMQGTPFIYQGEELGMTNIRLPIEEYQDVEIRNFYRERVSRGEDPGTVLEAVWKRGRDNARTPMQWRDAPGAGFTEGKPWLPVNPNCRQINAESQLQDPDSVYSYYRKLIRLRKEYSIFRDGDFRLILAEDPEIFAYERQCGNRHMLVMCNFSGNTRTVPGILSFRGGKILIENESGWVYDKLGPWGTRVLYYEDQGV